VEVLDSGGTRDTTFNSQLQAEVESGPDVALFPAGPLQFSSGIATLEARGTIVGTASIGFQTNFAYTPAQLTITPDTVSDIGIANTSDVDAGTLVHALVQLQDQFGNLVPGEPDTSVSINVEGSVSGTSLQHPQPNTFQLTMTSGQALFLIQSFVAEDITIDIIDSAQTGLRLTTPSSFQFVPGPAAAFQTATDVMI
jgi:hypothetical protein